MYLSSESSSIYNSSIEAGIYLSTSVLCYFSIKFPSSNCAKVTTLPVCSCYNVAYIIHKTSGCIESASEYRSDVYANTLENVFSNTASCEENNFRALGT